MKRFFLIENFELFFSFLFCLNFIGTKSVDIIDTKKKKQDSLENIQKRLGLKKEGKFCKITKMQHSGEEKIHG